MVCAQQSIIGDIVGILLCIGGASSYIPQYYSLIKAKTTEGLSELSYFLLNIGSCTLAVNSIILNWYKWKCFEECDFWLCNSQLLSTYQIGIGFLIVLPLYLIFFNYKYKNISRVAIRKVWVESEQYKKRRTCRKIIIHTGFFGTYILFIVIIVILALTEQYNTKFMIGFAKAMGIISAICSCVVWIPQIVELIKTKERGNLSLLMFILQAPGNGIIIFFQAYLYKQNVTTWFPYVITLIQQTIIIILIIIFYCMKKRQNQEDNWELFDDENSFLDEEDNVIFTEADELTENDLSDISMYDDV